MASCSHDDDVITGTDAVNQTEILDQPANSTVFSRSVTDCGFIPELCTRPFIAVAHHELAPFVPCCDSLVGGDDPVFTMTVKEGDATYTVYTLDLFEDSEDYVVVDEQQNIFFLLKTENEYLARHSKEIPIPKTLNIVADLDYTKFREGSITQSEISNSFGEKASVSSINDELVIDITGTDDDDVQALIRYDWCKFVIPSTIRKFKKELMSSYDILGDNSSYRLDLAIEDAVNECTPNLCLDCADSRCVLDAILDHPSIGGVANADEVKTDIKINYLRLLLDLSDEQAEWLKNNPLVLDDLFETYDLNFKGNDEVSSRSIGCDLNICGAEGAANAHINLLMAGVDDSDINSSTLCDFYVDLYEENRNLYKKLIGDECLNNMFHEYLISSNVDINLAKEAIEAYYAFLASHPRSILIDYNVGTGCSEFGDVYVRCADVIFASPLLGKRITQFEIKQYMVALCFGDIGDDEQDESEALGLLRNASLKIEARIPDFLFSGPFGYENMQTAVAKITSDAINFARSKIDLLNHCSELPLIRFQYRKEFFDYLNDPDVLETYFGSSWSQVEFFQNYQSSPPNYSPEETIPAFFEFVTDCN